MIHAVLDSNVLVAGFPAESGTMAELIDLWRAGTFRLVTSKHIMDEVRRAWEKPYWQARFSPSQAERALTLVERHADVTPITVDVSGIASHPHDDLVLATALSGGADYLATGDKALLTVGQYGGVFLLSPHALLERLERGQRH